MLAENPKESEPYWIKRAIETWDFHRNKLVTQDKWTVEKTAKALRRSQGGVGEDLLIARWLKTHRSFLEKFEHQHQALAFIRRKKKEQQWDDIE